MCSSDLLDLLQIFVDPLFVERIEDKSGNVLSNFTSRKREAIGEQTAYLMVNLMQGVVNEGTAIRLRYKYIPEGPLAGKTGTTNDQSDGWFIGYVPRLTAGVWVGAEDRQVHFESLSLGGGSNMPLVHNDTSHKRRSRRHTFTVKVSHSVFPILEHFCLLILHRLQVILHLF